MAYLGFIKIQEYALIENISKTVKCRPILYGISKMSKYICRVFHKKKITFSHTPWIPKVEKLKHFTKRSVVV